MASNYEFQDPQQLDKLIRNQEMMHIRQPQREQLEQQLAGLRAQKKLYLEKRNQKDRAKFADERKRLKQSLLNFQLKLEQNSDEEEEKIESH